MLISPPSPLTNMADGDPGVSSKPLVLDCVGEVYTPYQIVETIETGVATPDKYPLGNWSMR